MKLFWVTTKDHDEDWFVVAESAAEASEFHEDEEGYEPGDATAEEVLIIPDGYPAETGWPSGELLVALGGTFISGEGARIVEINGRKYCEGLLEGNIRELADDVFEKQGSGRPNQTKRTLSD